jgi:hypothetical protein
MTSLPDIQSRSRDGLSAYFAHFGEVECLHVDGGIYRELCRVVCSETDLLDMAAETPPNQPAPNLLFAAVHRLLLGGQAHPLGQWYPELAQGEANPIASIGPAFTDFCRQHRSRIESLIRTRMTQTNVIQRCSGLLPGFGRVFEAGGERPLSLIEIGCSAGLNLLWDRFFYVYSDAHSDAQGEGPRWGDALSRVVVECEVRGNSGVPALPSEIPVAGRRGIDLHPIDLEDPEEESWLRALVWPDHPGRQERLTEAMGIARESPPSIERGDASVNLPRLIAEAPADTTLCVYGSHTLYQFPRESVIATFKAMQAASRQRDLHFLSIEAYSPPWAELRWTHYSAGEREVRVLARCSPHGRWLEWIDSPV